MSLAKKIRTVQWKFRDVTTSYPELNGVHDLKITRPEDVYKIFKFLFENETVERFVCFWLNAANKVIGFELISSGNLDSSVVHPREVFRSAIVASCKSIILAHNHPSGNLDPSNADIAITKVLVEAGKMLDIPVFDHLIISNNGYSSFVEKRLL